MNELFWHDYWYNADSEPEAINEPEPNSDD
jgi:hypothetical protein